MSRPGKGNKAPIFCASPLPLPRPALPSPGPGQLQVSLFSPTSEFSAQLSETPPPAEKRRVGREGQSAGRACRESPGDPATPAPACPRPPRGSPPAQPRLRPPAPQRSPPESRRWALPLAQSDKRAASLPPARPPPAAATVLSVSRLASHNKSLARS